MKLLVGLASTCLLAGGIALASPLTTLPGATFGGGGIPNTDVEVTTINNGDNTITLGLTATPKYPNQTIGSPLPNDGNGTFYATPGVGVTPGKATWNFDTNCRKKWLALFQIHCIRIDHHGNAQKNCSIVN